MREREMLRKLVAALDAGPTTPDTIAAIVEATEAARAELARPVPSVEDARADLLGSIEDYAGECGSGNMVAARRIDDVVRKNVDAFAAAVATAAVERHRAALESIGSVYGEWCEADDDSDRVAGKCMDKLGALLADAQKAG